MSTEALTAVATFGLAVVGLLFRGVWLASQANTELRHVKQSINATNKTLTEGSKDNDRDHSKIWHHLDKHREKIEQHDVRLENHEGRIEAME